MKPQKITDTLGFLLAETARTWRSKLNQRLKPLGLSQAQWVALVHLARAKQDMTQKNLAERIGIEGPTLVRLLDRMARDNWIVRRESALDRRSKTVHLTRQAKAILQEIQTTAAQLRKELLRGIPAADLAQCADVLRRIATAAQHI
jgi:MarR family transcriptional regulator for hemolysin